MTKPRILIKTHLHEGIYRSFGGGEVRIHAEYAYGPRNLVRAYHELLKVRETNRRNYGNIGCGHSWLETSDGRTLDTMLVCDDDCSQAELVKEIEGALMTREQHDKMDR